MEKISIGKILRKRREEFALTQKQILPMLIMSAPEFDGKPPTLSFEQATILDEFDSMNREE